MLFVGDDILKDFAGMNWLAARQIGFIQIRSHQILIDKLKSAVEQLRILRHELYEVYLMLHGWNYWKAHEAALKFQWAEANPRPVSGSPMKRSYLEFGPSAKPPAEDLKSLLSSNTYYAGFDIDPEIRPMIAELNQEGYPTVSSCAGHEATYAEPKMPAYVTFADKVRLSPSIKLHIEAIMKSHGARYIKWIPGSNLVDFKLPPQSFEANPHSASGPQIAQKLGIHYDGVQPGAGIMEDMLQFTDSYEDEEGVFHGTGTTFYARNLREARRKLREKRRLFGVT